MVYVYILVLLINSVYSSDSFNSLLDIDDPEFWKSISDSIPSQSENEELFRIIQKSLCGESLTLDNREWWQYSAKIGHEFKQYHIDRPGLIKKQTDPVPNEFILGRWNSTECELSSYPTIHKLRASEIFIYGRLMRTIYYSNDAPVGWLDEWKVDINGEIVPILLKVSENLYILSKAPQKQGITRIYRIYAGRKKLNTNFSPVLVDNILVCFSCNFLTSARRGYQIVLVIYIQDTEFGKEIKTVQRVWDKIAIELSEATRSSVLKSENWPVLDNPNHEIYLRGSGTISWCGNLIFGRGTSFEKLSSDEDMLISYSRYNMNKVHFKQRSDSKFVPELYEIVKISQIFSNDTLELIETPVNSQIEGEFLYYTKAKRNDTIYEPIERNSYWSVECPGRISFNPVDSLNTYSGPCLALESVGKGLIAFSVTYPVLNSTVTPLEITLTSSTSSHLTLLLGTSKGYGIKLQYKSKILYERVYSSKLLQDNLGNTSIYLAIYNSSLILGLGQKLGSLIKLRISDPLLSSIISLSISSLHPVSIYDLYNLSIQPFMESVLDTIISIPAPNKSITLIEEIDPGDSCGSSEHRKTQVEYICAEDNSILEVDEYMPCRYRLVLGTPLLCPIKFDFLPPTRSINFSMDKVIYMRRRRYRVK